MKMIRHVVVAAALTGGLMSRSEAHVFVGVGIGPAVPVAPMVPVPVYAPPPGYYVPPPPPLYAAPPVYVPPPVVVGYYGYPRWWYRNGYGYGYWR